MARIKYWDEESQTWKYADKSLGVNIDLMEYAKKEDIPEKLPNPNALTINGTTYDGSEAVEVEIPTGGGEGWNVLQELTLAEDISAISLSNLNVQEIAIWFDGIVNDSTNSLADGSAQTALWINDTRTVVGNFTYIRTSGSFATLFYAKVYGNAVSGFVCVHSNPGSTGQFSGFGGKVDANSITNVRVHLAKDTQLFKAGGSVRIYGK